MSVSDNRAPTMTFIGTRYALFHTSDGRLRILDLQGGGTSPNRIVIDPLQGFISGAPSTLALAQFTLLGIVPSQGFAALAAAYTTASLTYVSTGVGLNLFPAGAGYYASANNIIFRLVAQIFSNTLGDGVAVALYGSNTSIPAQGAAPNAGDTLLANSALSITQEGLASNPHSAVFEGIVSTATAFTYYYIVVKAVTGGNATVAAGASLNALDAP